VVLEERSEIGQGADWVNGRAGEALVGVVQCQISTGIFRNEVAVGDVVVVDGLTQFFGAVSVAGAFEIFFDFAFEAFRIVFGAKFTGGIVAIFLEAVELAREPAENVDGGRKFFGVDCELFADVRLKKELGELGGDELKADFGELRSVGRAEMFQEIVLEESSLNGPVLFGAPIAIAAAGFPVRNVAWSGCDTVFGEGIGYFRMRDVVAKHAIDHVADGIGKAGDFAVTTDFAGGARGWIIGLVDRWIGGWGRE
jgi:hypothetical protein